MTKIAVRPVSRYSFAAMAAFAGAAALTPSSATADSNTDGKTTVERSTRVLSNPPTSAAGPPAGTPTVYNGGRVIANVQVNVVLWSQNVYPQLFGNISTFFSHVTNSTYMDWLSEYDATLFNGVRQAIGRGSINGATVIRPNNTSNQLTDAQIQTELSQQITAGPANGGLPLPTANSLYMVYLPPGVIYTDQAGAPSCNTPGLAKGVTSDCGYHESFTYATGQDVVYGVITDLSPTPGTSCNCGPGTQFANTTAVSSHELIEAITDPDPFTGWSPEIGDPLPCNGTQRTLPTGDVVQAGWSNRYGACVAGFASGSIVGAVGGKCIEVPGGSTTNGTDLDYNDCNGGTNQQWQVTSSGQIIGANGGKCVDLPGFNTANQTDLQYYTCNGGANQSWMPANMEIRGFGNRCIDLTNNNNADGTGLQYFDCNGTSAQKWTFGSNGTITDTDAKCWEVANTNDSTQIQVATCNGGPNQQWHLGGNGTIIGNGGKCVDLPGWNTANNTPIHIYDCNGGANQQWTLDGFLMGYGLKCIDLPGFNTTNGINIQYYTCNSGLNQQWWIEP
jgi:hypothetical protein